MKGLSAVTGAFICLAVLLAAVGAAGGAVRSAAVDETLYGEKARLAVMDEMGLASEEEASAVIGLDAAAQDALAAGIAAGMAAEFSDFALEPLNERERAHLCDVHALIQAAQRAAQLCVGIAAGLAVAAAWTGARLERRRRAALLGGACGVLLLALLVGAAALAVYGGGFTAAFIRLHELLFTNDLWLMNPETDVLIRMMPQRLFERAAVTAAQRAGVSFAVICALLAAVYAIVGGMIRRNLSEREQA